jgi:hypothetical protein
MIAFAVILILVGTFFCEGMNYWLKQRVVSWSQHNIPKTFESAQIPYASYPLKAAAAFTRSKISWAVLCFIYAVFTIVVIRVKGFLRTLDGRARHATRRAGLGELVA